MQILSNWYSKHRLKPDFECLFFCCVSPGRAAVHPLNAVSQGWAFMFAATRLPAVVLSPWPRLQPAKPSRASCIPKIARGTDVHVCVSSREFHLCTQADRVRLFTNIDHSSTNSTSALQQSSSAADIENLWRLLTWFKGTTLELDPSTCKSTTTAVYFKVGFRALQLDESGSYCLLISRIVTTVRRILSYFARLAAICPSLCVLQHRNCSCAATILPGR